MAKVGKPKYDWFISLETVREWLDYNPDTGVFLWKKANSNRVKVGAEAGYLEAAGYRVISIEKVDYKAHRLAFLMMTGIPARNEIDHIDGNPTNNKWQNLREANRNQNLHNTRLSANNKSGIKGVHWDKQKNAWCAEFKAYYKRYHVGFFKDIQKASDAIRLARETIHREYANHG